MTHINKPELSSKLNFVGTDLVRRKERWARVHAFLHHLYICTMPQKKTNPATVVLVVVLSFIIKKCK